jgi:hypothetical protein
MLETVRDWKNEWIKQNGKEPTADIEVIIKSKNEVNNELYVGSFVGIDVRLLNKEVIEDSSVLTSSIIERIGAYILYV